MYVICNLHCLTLVVSRRRSSSLIQVATLNKRSSSVDVIIATDVFHGLLLPSDVERRSVGFRSAGQHNGAASEHQDAGRDLETGHVLPQRTRIVPAHHHLLQQAVSY